MDNQLSFSDSEFAQKRRVTRKEKFLTKMDGLVPWQRLVDLIEPYYPKAGNGRRPYPLTTMLRIHCLQQWYNLSDEAMEDALYDSAAMRMFVELSLDRPIPDRTTIMNFRHLLERHDLGRKIFADLSAWLSDAGVLFKEGTLMDATIIEAPSSTKNKENKRDPEMHQTKKGNEWHFGFKAHIGVDANTGMTHTFTTTAANEHDLNQADHLLHGAEKYVFADAGYRGIEKREALPDTGVDWFIAQGPRRVGRLKAHPRINRRELNIEHMQSSIRSKVEHVFRIIKCQFGFRKTRCRGLNKNDNKLATLFALANMVRLSQLQKTAG